jgi:hypothetical protein
MEEALKPMWTRNGDAWWWRWREDNEGASKPSGSSRQPEYPVTEVSTLEMEDALGHRQMCEDTLKCHMMARWRMMVLELVITHKSVYVSLTVTEVSKSEMEDAWGMDWTEWTTYVARWL